MPAQSDRAQHRAVARAHLRIAVAADVIACGLGAGEVGLPVVDGFARAARLLGFQQERWSPTLTVVATDMWAQDEQERDRIVDEGMLAVFELDDGTIVQCGAPVRSIEVVTER